MSSLTKWFAYLWCKDFEVNCDNSTSFKIEKWGYFLRYFLDKGTMKPYEYIERIHQMSYSSLSDNGMLQIFSFLIKWLYGTL